MSKVPKALALVPVKTGQLLPKETAIEKREPAKPRGLDVSFTMDFNPMMKAIADKYEPPKPRRQLSESEEADRWAKIQKLIGFASVSYPVEEEERAERKKARALARGTTRAKKEIGEKYMAVPTHKTKKLASKKKTAPKAKAKRRVPKKSA
jgi:hypothetical protein